MFVDTILGELILKLDSLFCQYPHAPHDQEKHDCVQHHLWKDPHWPPIIIVIIRPQKGCGNICALLGAIPCQLLGAVHLLLSSAHKTDHKKQRNKGAPRFPRGGTGRAPPPLSPKFQIVVFRFKKFRFKKFTKKAKPALESKEHGQLEEYFLDCGNNKSCPVR